MGENTESHLITIDLNEFRLHIALKKRTELILDFNSPSRKFYLCVIALVVNEMKKQGNMASIPLERHHEVLALLNETVGGSAGSSDKENLLPRIYRKWQHALPNLEDAPLFKVLRRKKGDGEGTRKAYSLTENEKDSWANLFEYMGSEENVRLKFAIDRIGAELDDVDIMYDGSLNGDAWDRFILNLREKMKVKPETVVVQFPSKAPEIPVSQTREQRTALHNRYRWIVLVVIIVAVVGAGTSAIWKLSLRPVTVKKASLERMAFPLPDKPSIAVLPFVNMGKDPEQEFFCDGLTEEIITTLSKSPHILVIARTSTFAYKGKPIRVDLVAEELGVRYVLKGSVRRAGERIRISAQLIDAITGHHLWAEHYDGTLNDVFALEDQITEKIVTALAVKLTAEEKETTAGSETRNVVAYEEFLKGWEHYLRFRSDDLAGAVQSFKKATELDPKYQRAYAALALTYWSGSNIGIVRKGLGVTYAEARLSARKYLKEAMKNPTSIAHLVNSQFYLYQRQHEEAISELQQALILEPNNPSCNALLGSALFLGGRPQEAVDFINRAIRLDPVNPARYLYLLGGAQFCMGNLEEAASLIEKGIRLNPELTGSAGWLLATYGLLGRDKEASAAMDIYKKGKAGEFYIREVMYFFPFKDRAVAERFVEGLGKAGVKGRPSNYLPAFKENQLSGDQVKKLLFGSTIIGILPGGQQWSVERKENGAITYHGPGPISADVGKSWTEGDALCQQYEKRFGGLEFCSTVFRNPKGTYEGKDEYFLCSDLAFSPFSVVR